jgi:tripartite-type tricarboxylate transporter receptor subunit TctC
MRRNFIAILFLLIGNANSQAQTEPFYKGKTITIVTDFSTGSIFDLVARATAQYWGKHIPGNPNIIVQNMPGAGSVVVANYVYGVAKPDGLTLGSISSGIYSDQLVGRKEVQFDWAKFSWTVRPIKPIRS